MYLLIRYAAGVVVEGVVLANGRNRMRVAAAGFADTIELQRSGLDWVDTGCQPVELEFMMARSWVAPDSAPDSEAQRPVRSVRAIRVAGAN
jgi:hypothetical protein